ncbi:hypothetical protein, partial [Serratia marcescens]|uniref:hypothetical protein n=1 Tax=Serratia marcescens TaxID=615 RepID=UPI0028135872
MEDHDKILREVLSKLCREGLTINSEKLIFGVEQVEFLGSILSKNGISISPKRIKAIKEFPSPATKKDLQ